MKQPTCLQLNIWCNGQCTFQLIWGDRQQMSTKVPYPIALIERYQAWQKLYLHVYSTLNRGRLAREGSLTSGIDWKHQLQEAEQCLLDNMHQWLGCEELLAIREKIAVVARPVDTIYPSNNGCPAWSNLLIACDHAQMIRLPWEAWRLLPKEKEHRLIRICRTPISGNELPTPVKQRSRSQTPRILAILSNASELNLQTDRAAIRSLEKVANIQFIELALQESAPSFKERLRAKIDDDRGWDLLFFSGHSDETSLTGGKIHLAQDIALSMSEIEPELIRAQERGLRVAIFNSCSGLSLAHSLIQLGVHQVVVMREQIQDQVAQVFLKQLCLQLADFQDLNQSLLNACNYFKSEQIAYPSISLIPSIFCHPQAEVFHFRRSRLQRLWRTWKPTRSESVTVGIAIAVSLMIPMQDLLLDSRTLMQAVYRDQTQQLPRNKIPPVQLISIDQTSINQAINTIEGFKIKPIDRRFLAQVVNRLAQQQNIKTIGIDYELYTEEPHNKILKQAISEAVDQGTWFVFAVNGQNQKSVFPKIASSNWSLQGDILFWPWFVEQPDDLTCERTCPFAYLLALTSLLHQDSSTVKNLKPSLQSRTSFQMQLAQLLQQKKSHTLRSRLKQTFSPWPWPSAMIDFSIPPNQVSQKIPALEFLNSSTLAPDIQQPILPNVALIASGEYEEAEDNFSVPLAINYWCYAQRHTPLKDCPSVFTGGEAQAYMLQHMIQGTRIILIPDFWMIGIAAILGKWTTLILLKQERQQRKQQFIEFSLFPIGYGIMGLQMYITAAVAIPWFWPSLIFCKYLLTLKKNYGE